MCTFWLGKQKQVGMPYGVSSGTRHLTSGSRISFIRAVQWIQFLDFTKRVLPH